MTVATLPMLHCQVAILTLSAAVVVVCYNISNSRVEVLIFYVPSIGVVYLA
jgi:hypothetical protein